MSKKDAKQFIREIERAGCKVTIRKGGHLRVDTPSGPVFMAATPSDHRALKNARALLRRKGVKL